MKNSIAWHDTFPEKYRVTKVVLQHVSDWKITKKLKKVFVKVSAIIMVFFVIICVICGLNCPIHPWGARALEFSVFFRSVFVPKNFGFWDSVFIEVYGFSVFYHLVSDFRQKYLSTELRIWSPMWFSDFSIWIPVSLRSRQAAIMRLHWSRIAAKPLYAPLVNTVWDRLGFWELRCEHL